jgi:hypothetical protein
MQHSVLTKTQNEDFVPINIESMKVFRALGKILKFKLYAEESLIFVLSHPEGEQNKHKIFYTKITNGGLESWKNGWKHFEIDTEVIDFCYGVTSKFLFVARKG